MQLLRLHSVSAYNRILYEFFCELPTLYFALPALRSVVLLEKQLLVAPPALRSVVLLEKQLLAAPPALRSVVLLEKQLLAAPPALRSVVLLEKQLLTAPPVLLPAARRALDSVPALVMRVPVGCFKTANSGLSSEQSERPISSSLGHSDDQTLKLSRIIVLDMSTLRVYW